MELVGKDEFAAIRSLVLVTVSIMAMVWCVIHFSGVTPGMHVSKEPTTADAAVVASIAD